MRIVCPSCAAAYNVPEARVSPGRLVRCARCTEEWLPVGLQSPLPDRALSALSPAPAPSPTLASLVIQDVDQSTQLRSQRPAMPARRRGKVLLLAWAGSLAMLGALVWAAYAWRADAMRNWPPSQRVYAALGLGRPP
jgi:predicted Zn finger-like uncharacterized protein